MAKFKTVEIKLTPKERIELEHFARLHERSVSDYLLWLHMEHLRQHDFLCTPSLKGHVVTVVNEAEPEGED